MNTCLNLPYGLRDGQLVSISKVANGLKCNCTCPGCDARLIARNQGKRRLPHFAHYKSAECRHGFQTALHLAAKDIIARHRCFRLPGAAGRFEFTSDFWQSFAFDTHRYRTATNQTIYQESIFEFPACTIPIENVRVEHRTADIIPDIILETVNGPLLVEIAVTHFIDEVKQKKIEQLGIPTIEIDLSNISQVFDLHQLEQQLIFSEENKRWAYNAKLAAKVSEKQAYYFALAYFHIEKIQLEMEQQLWQQKRLEELRQAFYTTQRQIIIQRKVSYGKVKHIEKCPLRVRSYCGVSYANVDIDCRRCVHCLGYEPHNQSIICLFTYNRLKSNNFIIE